MAVELNWRPHPLVSCLHAAEAVSRKLPLADPRLAAAMEAPANLLAAEIRSAYLPPERFWRMLVAMAANTENRRQLVETAVIRAIGRGPRFEQVVTNLTACVIEVDAAQRAALPNLAHELPLRERPLREQWEARGPGLLFRLEQLTEENLFVEKCDVLLVHPALGGGGDAHLSNNSVRIEAVLANPVAELPEVVRLAWLITQLNLDLPIYSESIHADRLPHIARYAMLPAVLAAAEAVELTRFTPQTVRQAIIAWRLFEPLGVDGAALALEWWRTYQEARPPLRVALAAFDQMFG
jgi:hypothetical protein